MSNEINVKSDNLKENANIFTNMKEKIHLNNGKTLIDNLKKSGETYNEYFNLISYIDVLFGVSRGLFEVTSSFLTKTGIRWDEVDKTLSDEIKNIEDL